MSVSQSSHYCATCGQQRLFVKQKPNHVLHLILSVLTVGIWALFVWIPLTMIAASKGARCTTCGQKPSIVPAPSKQVENVQAQVEVTEIPPSASDPTRPPPA